MMNRRALLASVASAALTAGLPAVAAARRSTRRVGAKMTWTTYPAAAMKTSGTRLGPAYGPHIVEMESTCQRCVKLKPGQFVEFAVRHRANSMVIRYSLPDSKDGRGIDAALALHCNGIPLRRIPVTSRFTWLYGPYPFTNDPKGGKPRHFYDDARISGLQLKQGDVIRLQNPADGAPYCIIDLVDLEEVPPPLSQPAGSLSVTKFGADATGKTDSTEAVRACLIAAAAQKRIVWVPAGQYKLTGDIILPTGAAVQGAGMWHTTFVGDEALYGQADRRVRFKLTGADIHIADFALMGKVKYRNDDEQNDGIFGAYAHDCSVRRIWVEHTKVGMWFYDCRNMVIEGCRMRNTFADGINLCVDTRDCVIENCSARNTGDDCFAIWPSPSDQGFTQESAKPGNNIIRHCTGQLPFLAQGGSIYGGASNRIEDCLFTDIASGCGILISTTFPTSNEKVDNNFSGTTVVRNCEIIRCGGYDQSWTWRAALQIAMQRHDISDLVIEDVTIRDSISDAIAVVVGGNERHVLRDAHLEHVRVRGYGIGVPGKHGLWIAPKASGNLTSTDCEIPNIRNGSTTFTIARQ